MTEVSVRFHNSYELLHSLHVFQHASNYKKSVTGDKWVKEVTEKCDTALCNKIATRQVIEKVNILSLFLSLHDLKDKTIDDVIRWVQQLSKQEVMEGLQPWLPQNTELPEQYQDVGHLLQQWNEQYFRSVKPEILSALHTDVQNKAALAKQMKTESLIEQVTNGFVMRGYDQVIQTLLIPRYHGAPVVGYEHLPRLHYYSYPVDIQSDHAENTPSPSLQRMTQAISDHNRLKILRFISKEPKSFTEIVHHIGLAKSTVHHHLVILRSSGLVQVIFELHKNETFKLREQAFELLKNELEDFVNLSF